MKSVLVALFRFSRDVITEVGLVAVSSLLYLVQELTLELEKIVLPGIGKIILGSKTLNDTIRSGQWTFHGVLDYVGKKIYSLPEMIKHVKSFLVIALVLVLLRWNSLESIVVTSTLLTILVYN